LKRHFLKDKEVKQLDLQVSEALHTKLSAILGPRLNVELVSAPHADFFLIDGRPLLMRSKGKIIPTLLFDEALVLLPKVVVDVGAIPHVCNGADIMAPGIVEVEGSFNEGAFVVIVDVRHKKPLAIGTANLNSAEILKCKQGKVIKNVHYVGDSMWELFKGLGSKPQKGNV